MPDQNIPLPSVNDATPQLLEFMEHKLDSLAKWDLIQFFHRKPSMVGTAPKIASMIGRDLRKVERELKDMAAKGLLEAHDKSGVKVYRLIEDKETRALVAEFVNACDNRQFREAAIRRTVGAAIKR
jgi:predicted ArsR family transcriptional regulator